MARIGITQRWAARRAIVAACLLAAHVLVTLGPASAHAAGTSAVTATTADPPAFVPNWDGETDATAISYMITARSSVVVRILDGGGRTVATIDAGLRLAGTHLVSWDGRADSGRVLPAGSYRVRVDATPRPLAGASVSGQPGAASLGTAAVAGARASTVVLQRPPIAVRGVRLTRASIGRSGANARTALRFDLSTAASISAAVVDASGRGIRTLVSGRMRAGTSTIPWNGRTESGAVLLDGDYVLVIAASGAGRPTSTTRVPLRVDRTPPTLRSAATARARVGRGGVIVPLSLVATEPGSVTVQVGRRSARLALAAGTNRLSIPGRSLGIAVTKRSRIVPVRLLVADHAGNAIARSIRVTVPAAARTTTTTPPPPPAPTPTSPAPTGGRLLWPIDGPVTSQFGMRGGRPHTGIDIADPAGTPVHPATTGTVSYVGSLGGYGNVVLIDHPHGIRTYYAHLSRFGGFGVGQHVTHLDVIGYVGCTGHCTGPHVHFEVRVGDVPRDPLAYLRPR